MANDMTSLKFPSSQNIFNRFLIHAQLSQVFYSEIFANDKHHENKIKNQ